MEQIRRAFASLVAPGDGRLAGNLDEGALLIASAMDPDVAIADELERLDELAMAHPADSAASLAVSLFGGAAHDPSQHFSGNQREYYDLENSLLHRVMARRMGIPITLSVLLIEIGRRHEIDLHGVGMPGHFLVGSSDGFIDAFHAGVLLDAAGCERVYQRLAGPESTLPEGSLVRTPPAMILKRILFNLSAIAANYQQRTGLRSVRSLLAAFPDSSHRDHVQHAYAAAEIGQFHEAALAGERALETIPEQVRDKLASQIDGWRARLN